MSIRFKFRSSVNFDTLEIDGDKPYISVGELRKKIMCQKKLNNVSQKDFDLVFSDAITGQEYNDDRFEIPSCSSVIVKRVPVEPAPAAMLRYQRLEASELCDDIKKGLDPNKPDKIVLEEKLEPDSNKQIKLENVANSNSMDLLSAGLPPELRCSLCNTYFKEAVMIPCCQRSFCEKCIHEALVVQGSCPWCSSTKSRVKDLLPNLCLRQAIKHFLESQLLATAPENDLQKYVPDGESGIQGKDIPSAPPINKRKKDLFTSTSAMKKGSNQEMAESADDSMNMKNSFLEGSEDRNSNAIGHLKSTSLLKVKHSDRDRDRPEDLALAANSRDINQPLNMPQAHMPVQGGDQRFRFDSTNRKVDRTCYMCGSPDHLIRDCPIAPNRHPMSHAGGFSGNPMFQGGMPCYSTPYWSGAAFPPINPYMTMYGNPGLVPFGGSMVPITPYRVPHYLPSTYSSLPVPSGTMMGSLEAPFETRSEQPLTHSEILEPWLGDNRRNFSDERRERSFDEDDVCYKRRRVDELHRSVEYKPHREWGKTPSNSEESHEWKMQREHHCDKHLNQKVESIKERHEKHSHSPNAGKHARSYHTDRSILGVANVQNNNDRYDEARHKKHYRNSTRHHERREQSGSGSTWSRHHIQEERGVKRKVESSVDFKHKRNSYPSGAEHSSSSGDQKKRWKDVNPGPIFREPRERTKPLADKFYGDRWKMVKVSDEDCTEGDHHKGKKRRH
ncbi:E3 ubiquitin ligase PARAQUAT TOLERANCE 3-like isoform X1 [Cynara cardunculus var. scolymus]|uniref:E3 ubiquitin ligase PARAQUAT TOLERANCE 3-like isoform X1 n=1 Tax=Cynara cardunculus var. scolymus TaxID=59895 RepID=UPI000D629618|nr:E3 ubiquitin ligase PARAQUAT TOLERANCE 3-like isoform X1 [Cynara cardunculus var. scolymus]